MQKTLCPLHQNLSSVGKHLKRRTSDPDHSFSRRLIHSSSLESDQPRSKIPYKRKYKFKYLIYSVLLLLNFCLFVIAPSSHATSKPSDAKGKNIIKEEKTCPKGQYLNPDTKRCKKFPPQKFKTCKPGYFLNKITGRCHKIAAPTTPKTCPAGKTLNPVTNRCKGEERSNEIKPCKEGYERNETTHRCRKIHQNTGATNPVEVPNLGDNKENQKKDFKGTAAVAGSAAVGFGIAIFQFKNEIFVIIRKIFFHK